MRTRSFVFGTLLLVIGVLAIALLPVIVRYIDRQDATRVAVVASAEDLTVDPVATLTGCSMPRRPRTRIRRPSLTMS